MTTLGTGTFGDSRLGGDPTFANELYGRIAPLTTHDAQHGNAMYHICRAVGGMMAPLEVVRDDDHGPGYSSLLDLDRAPAGGLGWLGMFAGVRIVQGLSDAEQRERIDATDGFKRGTPGAILTAAKKSLSRPATPILLERYPTPYSFRVITYTSQTPDPARVVADVREQKPVGLVFTHAVHSGWMISEMESAYAGSTITILEADFTSVTNLESRVL